MAKDQVAAEDPETAEGLEVTRAMDLSEWELDV